MFQLTRQGSILFSASFTSSNMLIRTIGRLLITVLPRSSAMAHTKYITLINPGGVTEPMLPQKTRPTQSKVFRYSLSFPQGARFLDGRVEPLKVSQKVVFRFPRSTTEVCFHQSPLPYFKSDVYQIYLSYLSFLPWISYSSYLYQV